MDTLSAGVVDAPVNSGGATATEMPVDTQGQGSVAPENENQAGASQEVPEGSPVNGQDVRQRGPSKLDTIRELRAKLRDQRTYWESEIGSLRSQIEELKQGFASGRNGQKPSKTFWEAPEEVLEERLSSHLSELEKRMLTKIEQRQVEDQEASVRQQELSEAAKFIRSQKGITEDDIADIKEILASKPYLSSMPPMEQAEYVLSVWQKQRGISDRSASKQRASTVTGAPPAAGGAKMWTESEIDAEMKKFPPNVANWSKEDETRFKKLDDEIRRAYREKRVTK